MLPRATAIDDKKNQEVRPFRSHCCNAWMAFTRKRADGSLHGKGFTLKRAEGSLHGEGCLQDVQRSLCTCAFRWPANLYTYIGPMVPGLSAEVPISICILKGSSKRMFFFPWRARSGPFLRPLRQDSLFQLAWQFEGGKCPLTYLISCTVFLAPYALQIANSRLDLKSLEDTVKLGVYSPTSSGAFSARLLQCMAGSEERQECGTRRGSCN